jgi:hypothetical protein
MDRIYRLQGVEFEWDERIVLRVRRGGCMKKHEEESSLRLRPRQTEVVSITLPKDALESLK